MKILSLLAAATLTLSIALVTGDAEAAKRFGGGKSFGMQRQTTAPAQAPTAAPATAPSAAKAQPATTMPQTPPRRSWMGPLAGLAAGLGLAALASHFGFGEELASMLTIGLLVMAGLALVGFIARRRAAAAAAPGVGGIQYAAAGSGDTAVKPAYEVSLPASAAAASSAAAGSIPADFDVEGFTRNAKLNFIRLQAANDAGNLEDIREFTTPEVFAEIRMALAERGAGTQQTDVVALEAEVIDVAEEASRYVVSVRFKGLIREDSEAAAEPVDEIWHLTKPRDGKGGWVVAGIQQTH